MDAASSLLGYLSIYDLFARMAAGAVVLLMSSLLGIYDFILGSTEASTVLAFIVLSYFAGIILEEISHILENIFHGRKKWEDAFCKKREYIDYDFDKCKKALARNGNNDVSDKSLSHIVMSSSISIGFFILILVKAMLLVIERASLSTWLKSVPVAVILLLLIWILHFRKRNYTERRMEQIIDFCIAKGYEDIHKDTSRQRTDRKNSARKSIAQKASRKDSRP